MSIVEEIAAIYIYYLHKGIYYHKSMLVYNVVH